MDDLIENLPNARRKQEDFDYLAQGRSKYNTSNKLDISESFLDNRKGNFLNDHSKHDDMFNMQPSFDFPGFMGDHIMPRALESLENTFDQGKYLVSNSNDNPPLLQSQNASQINNNSMFPHTPKYRLDETPKARGQQDSPVNMLAAQFQNYNEKYAPSRNKLSQALTTTEEQIKQQQFQHLLKHQKQQKQQNQISQGQQIGLRHQGSQISDYMTQNINVNQMNSQNLKKVNKHQYTYEQIKQFEIDAILRRKEETKRKQREQKERMLYEQQERLMQQQLMTLKAQNEALRSNLANQSNLKPSQELLQQQIINQQFYQAMMQQQQMNYAAISARDQTHSQSAIKSNHNNETAIFAVASAASHHGGELSLPPNDTDIHTPILGAKSAKNPSAIMSISMQRDFCESKASQQGESPNQNEQRPFAKSNNSGLLTTPIPIARLSFPQMKDKTQVIRVPLKMRRKSNEESNVKKDNESLERSSSVSVDSNKAQIGKYKPTFDRKDQNHTMSPNSNSLYNQPNGEKTALTFIDNNQQKIDNIRLPIQRSTAFHQNDKSLNQMSSKVTISLKDNESNNNNKESLKRKVVSINLTDNLPPQQAQIAINFNKQPVQAGIQTQLKSSPAKNVLTIPLQQKLQQPPQQVKPFLIPKPMQMPQILQVQDMKMRGEFTGLKQQNQNQNMTQAFNLQDLQINLPNELKGISNMLMQQHQMKQQRDQQQQQSEKKNSETIQKITPDSLNQISGNGSKNGTSNRGENIPQRSRTTIDASNHQNISIEKFIKQDLIFNIYHGPQDSNKQQAHQLTQDQAPPQTALTKEINDTGVQTSLQRDKDMKEAQNIQEGDQLSNFRKTP